MTDDKVTCQRCGYLTAEKGATKEHIELPAAMRENGTRTDATIGFAPVCHVHACEITAEYHSKNPSGDGKGPEFLTVIRTPRVCPKFIPHQCGLSPAELLDRIRALEAAQGKKVFDMELLRLQAELSERAAERQRLWQESQDIKRIAAQKDRDLIQDKRNAEMDGREAARLASDITDRKWRRRFEVFKFCVTGLAIAGMGLVSFYASRHYAEVDRHAEDARKTAQVAPATK